jgi:hypothetical protein
MKKSSGNPNLPTKTGNYLPNIEQTKQVIQQANVNDKALSNILNSRDPEFWLEKVREALDREAWTEAAYYGLKALFFDADYYKADIVLAYAFGRLRDIDKSLFYMKKVDRFGEVEADVYRSLLSMEELYFLSVHYNGYDYSEYKYYYEYEVDHGYDSFSEYLDHNNAKFDIDFANNFYGNCYPESTRYYYYLEDNYNVSTLLERLKEIVPIIELNFIPCSKLSKELLLKAVSGNINTLFLNFKFNYLISLPKEIGQLTKLIYLDLEQNELTSLPKEIGQLINLEEMFLSDNQLTSLPKEIGQLTNLTYLDLRDNQLTSLPKEIGQLTNLTYLDLRDNQLTSLPKEIWQLTNLRGLYLSTNPLTSLPKEIGQLINLEEMFLSDNQLTSLPTNIGELINLSRMQLSENQLTSLPKEIGQLSNLWQLILNNNNILYTEQTRIKNLLPNCKIHF